MVIDFFQDKTFGFTSQLWQKEIVSFVEDFRDISKDHVLVSTSGSTGMPKQIKVSKSAMLASAQMTISFFNLKKHEKCLLAMPSKYIAGKMLIVRALLGEMILHCIEPKTILSHTDNFDFVPMTPMQAENSLAFINQCKIVILGGMPVNNKLEKKLLKANVYETYGMTETLTHIAVRKLNAENFFQTLPGVELRLDNRECLCIKVPYLDTEIVTNDLVELVDKDKFILKGRIDFVINSGGVKIQTEEVERKIFTYIQIPFIYSFLEDPILGQKPILIIEGKKQELIIPDIVFAKYEKPKAIYFLQEFCRSDNQKILREKTRQKLIKHNLSISK